MYTELICSLKDKELVIPKMFYSYEVVKMYFGIFHLTGDNTLSSIYFETYQTKIVYSVITFNITMMVVLAVYCYC